MLSITEKYEQFIWEIVIPLTSHIFLQHIVVFEDRTQQALRMVVDNQDLPSSPRIHRLNRVQKAFISRQMCPKSIPNYLRFRT